MQNSINRLPDDIKKLIFRVYDIACRERLKAYLVGGFVRDLMLGVRNLDLDIVIEGDGINFARIFAQSFKAKVTAHKQFGTATVFLDSGLKVDFSSARKEYYPRPAHLPVVKPGTLKDDLFRRDFSINAMAIDISSGVVIDYFGGKSDLRRRTISVLHGLSFIDDPTRLLRAVRFKERYNFKIEPKTLKLMKEAAGLKMLEKVHAHRIRDDLILLLKEKNVIKQIRAMDELLGFGFISPKLKVNTRTYGFLNSLDKEIRWFKKNYPKRRALDSWLIYLMGLTDGLNAVQIKGLCLKFGLRKGEEKRLLTFKQAGSTLVKRLSSKKVTPQVIFNSLEPLSYETILALRAKYKNPVFRKSISDFLEIYNGMRIILSGDDLHGLGVLPGPKYQSIFTQVLSAKLEGLVKNKKQELELTKRLLKKRSWL